MYFPSFQCRLVQFGNWSRVCLWNWANICIWISLLCKSDWKGGGWSDPWSDRLKLDGFFFLRFRSGLGGMGPKTRTEASNGVAICLRQYEPIFFSQCGLHLVFKLWRWWVVETIMVHKHHYGSVTPLCLKKFSRFFSVSGHNLWVMDTSMP